VSIIGDGGYAGINTPSGDGVTIATAGINVNLRSLTIAGLDTATNGIHVTSVGILHVEGCVISGFTNGAILVELAADDSQILIKEMNMRNNGFGIFLGTSTGTVRGSIDNCRAERNNGGGFVAYLNSRVTVNRSVASGNGGPGFDAISDVSGITAELSCEECISSNNGSGFQVETNIPGAAATIRVSHSTATNNQFGFNQTSDGVFESLKNNLVAGNGNDIAGTITPITAQ
jgi:hypothetical protein